MPRFSVESVWQNIAIAFDTLRVNKLRSGLTILGVVIGVSTVMTMAFIVQGIQNQITNAINLAGPTTFYVMKVFSTSPVNPDQLPKWIRIRPDLTFQEADRLASLPGIAYAGIWAQVQARIEYRGERTRPTIVTGADEYFQEIQGGELAAGRWFTKSELRGGAPVAVIQEAKAFLFFWCLNLFRMLLVISANVIPFLPAPSNTRWAFTEMPLA